MSLLQFRSIGKSEWLFENYIRRVYTSRLLEDYFSFLTHEHFSFIHEYADKRLNLPRPDTSYAKAPPIRS